ncbi:hypothetical protein F971_03303 [Acinetobacter vivianii]|uniref:Right handed beta helix domain-containing protein n=1 Tax=Acinetobacter vivianii TaxID=1776742 RepID=N8UUU1_9GAMM|nr:hypothetical protein [Acinetobacter vivianii]ENU91165.1 hypothetical protein F971_03303 [Acinetobacter vivianii]
MKMISIIPLLGITFCSIAQAQFIIVPNSSIDTDILISQAVDKGEKNIVLAQGIHFFSGTLRIQANDISIRGEGIVKVKEPFPLLLDLKGNNLNVSLNVDGENKLSSVMKLSGSNINVFNSNIKNLYAKNNSSVAILINSNGFFSVRNNFINNLYSQPDFKLGNGVGMARAIAIVRRKETIEPIISYISGNNISNIMGEEGDAITLLSKVGDKYSGINVNVVNNNISNYSRRAIKIQGEDVFVSGNRIKNVYNQGVNYNCSFAISVYAPKDITVKNNNINDSVCSAINVLMEEKNASINDVGNVIIDGNKINGNKMGFKVGDLKAPSSMLKTGKILFMPKNENVE